MLLCCVPLWLVGKVNVLLFVWNMLLCQCEQGSMAEGACTMHMGDQARAFFLLRKNSYIAQPS